MKVNVSLGVTLCTNEEKRNFLRLGIDALEVDVAGDVEAQAQAAITVGIKVLKILDGGLCEQVEEVVAGFEGVPVALREELGKVRQQLARLETKLVPCLVERVVEVTGRVTKLEGLVG